jgi:O-antigen/teichoic acid export membrane protein
MPDSPARGFDITKAAHGTLSVFIATIGGLGLNYIYGVCLARWLGADSFGLYSLGLTVFNLLAVVSVMGLDHAVLRFVPASVSLGKVDPPGSVLKVILASGCVLGVVSGLSLLASSETLSAGVFHKQHLAKVLNVFALGIPAYVCGTLLLSALQAFHDIRWRLFIRYVSEPVVRFVLAYVLISRGWGLTGAMTGFILAIWLSVGLSLPPLSRFLVGGGGKSGAAASLPWGGIARYCSPFLFGLTVNGIATRSDILLLGYYCSAHQAGLYAASLLTAAILILVLQSVESIIAPHLSEALAAGDHAGLRDLYALALRWVFVLALPLFIVFVLFPGEIVGLFGNPFKSAATCFAILALAKFVDLATGSANYILLLSGRSGQVTKIETANGFLQIALNLALIPKYGIEGAALALLASTVAVNLIRLGTVYFHYRVLPYRRELVKPALAGGIVLVLFALVRAQASVPPASVLMPAAFFLYFSLLLLLGLHHQDRTALTGILRRLSRQDALAK